MFRVAERPRLPRKHFRSLETSDLCEKELISFTLGAPQTNTNMRSCLSVCVSISSDCHLILCRHHQCRVLDWVVRSLKSRQGWWAKSDLTLEISCRALEALDSRLPTSDNIISIFLCSCIFIYIRIWYILIWFLSRANKTTKESESPMFSFWSLQAIEENFSAISTTRYISV